MIRIVELDGTPVATAACLSAAAETLRHVYPGWYHVLEIPRPPRSSGRALRRWGIALRHVDGRVVMLPDAPPASPAAMADARPAAFREVGPRITGTSAPCFGFR
jgi:hypothetical protein